MEILVLLMPVVMAVIGLSFFAFWLMMLIHCLKSEKENKVTWFLVILFLSILGAVLYRAIEYNTGGPEVAVAG